MSTVNDEYAILADRFKANSQYAAEWLEAFERASADPVQRLVLLTGHMTRNGIATTIDEPVSAPRAPVVLPTAPTLALPPAGPKGRPPRFWMPDAVFEQGLTSHELAVYAFLCRTAGKSRRCWPALSTIAEAGRMNRGTAVEAIQGLEGRNMVTRRKRFSQSVVYTLTPPEQWQQKSLEPTTGISTVVPRSSPVVPKTGTVVPLSSH